MFPSAPRKELPDRYNFLALPGIAERRAAKGPLEEAMAKSRMWTHEFIKCCMKEKEQGKEVDAT